MSRLYSCLVLALTGTGILLSILLKELVVSGLIVYTYTPRFHEAITEMAQWIKEVSFLLHWLIYWFQDNQHIAYNNPLWLQSSPVSTLGLEVLGLCTRDTCAINIPAKVDFLILNWSQDGELFSRGLTIEGFLMCAMCLLRQLNYCINYLVE